MDTASWRRRRAAQRFYHRQIAGLQYALRHFHAQHQRLHGQHSALATATDNLTRSTNTARQVLRAEFEPAVSPCGTILDTLARAVARAHQSCLLRAPDLETALQDARLMAEGVRGYLGRLEAALALAVDALDHSADPLWDEHLDELASPAARAPYDKPYVWRSSAHGR